MTFIRTVRRATYFVATCFVFSLLLPSSLFAQTSEVVDEIVAVVGDQIILRSDVDGFVAGYIQQQQVPYSENLWMEALNQLIDQKVMTVHARRDTTIKVEDAQVEQSLTQRINQLTAQVGGQNELEELYGKSTLQIKDELRSEFRDRMLAEQFQNRKLRQIRVTPTEVKDWFSQFPTDSLPTLPDLVRVSHIVRYPEITEAARNEAMEIISAIRDSVVNGGASFETLATQFSDDLASARNGGRDSGRRLGELVPEFAAVASRIPIGEISQVFETQFGLHILRVNERRGDVIDYNHILIRFDESKSDPTNAIAYLNAVRDSILAEEIPFERMTRIHSEEESTAMNGGRVVEPRSGERDLPLNALGPSWRNTISSLKEGEISEPAEVELLDGRKAYHILLLQRRTPSHRVGIEEDYERIEQIALQEKQNRELRKWLDKLREDVYVELHGKAEDLSVASR